MTEGIRRQGFKNNQHQIDCWNSYLSLFDTLRRESLISWESYWRRAEAMQESVWGETSSGLSHAEKRLVHEAIAKLTTREQQVIHLIFWQDLSLSQVAERLQVTKSTTQTLKRRAIQKLRKLLSYDPRIVRDLKSSEIPIEVPKHLDTIAS
ncbi:MAG: sigma-70 family RNA polymerase sigma factor [Bdellovibrionaceae bacterium]|nr:sigma-70 family RNA polymerase sigma factor [Pseudobdellovibrionaceae bacterium]